MESGIDSGKRRQIGGKFMGVLCTAYSIPAPLMRKIRADNDNLAFILGIEDEIQPEWKVDDYDFDKGFEDIIGVLRQCGYRKIYKLLDGEGYFYSEDKNYIDYEGYDIWIVTPANVKFIVKELEKVTLAQIKAAGIAEPLTDYYNKVIPENSYKSYLGYIRDMKKFFNKAAGQGNYLLFAEA
jgi:hypothetical protein